MANLPPLRDVIERHGLGARKSLGQHFLLDLNITQKIVRLAGVNPGDQVLEIGPGPGGLTRALLEAGADVTAVERDQRCIAALVELGEYYPGKLQLLEGDALTIDECETVPHTPFKIVANLPYNISTELLIKWLKLPAGSWSRMALMFQKEVADRILARPGTKPYGRLSIIAQAASRPLHGFDLPARAFTPPPQVASTVVLFDPLAEHIDALPALEIVTQAAFSQRRKMVRASLKSLFGETLEAALAHANVLETQRPEELSVDQFLKFASFYADRGL